MQYAIMSYKFASGCTNTVGAYISYAHSNVISGGPPDAGNSPKLARSSWVKGLQQIGVSIRVVVTYYISMQTMLMS